MYTYYIKMKNGKIYLFNKQNEGIFLEETDCLEEKIKILNKKELIFEDIEKIQLENEKIDKLMHMKKYAIYCKVCLFMRKQRAKIIKEENEEKIKYEMFLLEILEEKMENIFNKEKRKESINEVHKPIFLSIDKDLLSLKQTLEIIDLYIKRKKDKENDLVAFCDELIKKGYTEKAILLFYKIKLEKDSKKIKVYHA